MSEKEYTMDDLVSIVKQLRAPEGCPWDRVQTHESIRFNLIEETYEAADAIDTKDEAALKEELGDVLLQVVFHSVLGEEENSFDFNQVVQGVCEKLVYRHPHVFSGKKANTSEEALGHWEEAKKIEKHQKTVMDTLQAVPKAFPALLRAQKVGKRASKGLRGEEENVLEYLAAAQEICLDLQEDIAEGKDNASLAIGDLLFITCNIARLLQVESEDCLQKTTDVFIAEVDFAEQANLPENFSVVEESETQAEEELCNKLVLLRKMKSGGMKNDKV